MVGLDPTIHAHGAGQGVHGPSGRARGWRDV